MAIETKEKSARRLGNGFLTLYKEEVTLSPLKVVMSGDLEWNSLEDKSHSPKAEQEDRKILGSS